MDTDTTASYSAAGFGKRTEPGARVAVLVVDMCAAYFDAASPLDIDQPEVIAAVRELVSRARNSEVPVFWTRVEFPVGGDGGVWFDKVPALSSFETGNRLGDWLPQLSPTAGEVVVTKQHASGFFGTGLDVALRAAAIDTVIVCGVSTSGCVRATVTDASAHGFIPYVVREAVGDRTPAVHDANLFDLNAKYADVVSVDRATGFFSVNKN